TERGKLWCQCRFTLLRAEVKWLLGLCVADALGTFRSEADTLFVIMTSIFE
ncbi:hypothetical protein QQF64_035070, partial [Cirrhinus molitorella]